MIYRFKKRIVIALIKLQSIRYIMIDVKAEKDSRTMIQNIFRHVKAVNLNSIQNQLTMTWNALNCEFRFQISKSSAISTIRQFLFDLDIHADIWYEIIKSRFHHSKSESNSIFKWIIYSKQSIQFFRWKTRNRDFFKIMTNFMNFFSTTDQTKYFSAYHNQKSFRNSKFDLNHVFNSKIIIEFSFKIRLQITSKKNPISEKIETEIKTKTKSFTNQKRKHIWRTKTRKKKSIITISVKILTKKKNWKRIMKKNPHSKRQIKKISSWN